MKNQIIAGLDLGTTKIACIIANVTENGNIDIVGVGVTSSAGLRKGMVVSHEKTAESVRRATNEAEKMAGIKLTQAYTGIAGDHIRGQTSRGVIAISRPTKEIAKSDIDRVIEQAKAVSIPMDREIIHAIPQGFIVDEQAGIQDPAGLLGVRLEADVHIITGAVTSAQNIYKSVEKAGVQVRDLVLQPIASSYAVLDSEEKELGVILIDIGGGTTDIALFYEGTLRDTFVIGLGGVNITNDIAIGLRTPRIHAEEIKRNYGVARENLVGDTKTIDVPGIGGRPDRKVKRKLLASIIQPRIEEMLTLGYRELRKSEYIDLVSAGVVVTGGCAKMKGIEEIAESIFGLPTRVGVPNGIGGVDELVKDPTHATGVGLILYGYEHKGREGIGRPAVDGSVFTKIIDRMKRWLLE
ncbi:cell division protein FtsA [candidate division WOR-3 bacterium]|nr:cell division protein FtsA [candidate division WOR-3 bacterium]